MDAPPAQDQDKAKLDREFSDLYRANLRDVYSYSYYRVGNHHDAEDLTEQTFLQAYRHFERVRCPEAEAWAASCVSVPCFPEITDGEVAQVCDALAAVQDLTEASA